MNTFFSLLKTHKDIAIFLVLMVIFRSSFADINRVPTGSMQPTIVEGDRIVVNKLAYDIQFPLSNNKLLKLADPVRGDIVVFKSEATDTRLVKRVIGVPGDQISMLDNQLSINGVQLKYSNPESHSQDQGSAQDQGSKGTISAPFVDLNEDLLGVDHAIRLSRSGSSLDSFSAITIPHGYFLALGDNRDNSADSRVIGLIPRSDVIGRSQRVLLSLNPNQYYWPRADRFFKRL